MSEYGWEEFNARVSVMIDDLRGKDIDYVVALLRSRLLPANRTLVRGSSILGPIVVDPDSRELVNPSWLQWDE